MHDPLEDLPSNVRAALVAAGWRPGESRRRLLSENKATLLQRLFKRFDQRSDPYDAPYFIDHQFLLFRSAEKILDELWGLRIDPLCQEGPLLPQTVWFSLSLVSGLEDEIN